MTEKEEASTLYKKSQIESQHRSQHFTRYRKSNRLKELGFTTNWSVNDQKKNYDALEDPYANRYFRYSSVKTHIKQLKKSLDKEERNSTQKKKIESLIKEKIKSRLPAINDAAHTYEAENQFVKHPNLRNSTVGASEENTVSEQESKPTKKRKGHLKKKQKTQKFPSARDKINYSIQPISQREDIESNERGIDQSSSKKDILRSTASKKDLQRQSYLKKQNQMLHQKKHEDFMSFIAKKKESLNSAADSKQPQESEKDGVENDPISTQRNGENKPQTKKSNGDKNEGPGMNIIL